MQSFTAICYVILLWVSNSATAEESRIYDGYAIKISDAPYMAQIFYVDDVIHECGGGILTKNLILTAGHCTRNSETLEDHDADGYTVLVGATKHNDFQSGQTMYVEDVYPHPEFKGQQGQLYHDVGILRLSSDIMLGKNTGLIALALPSDETPEGRKIIISGWGVNPQHPKDKRLYQAKMAVTSYRECAKRHKEEFKEHEICAKPVEGKTCPGDSGCPAIDTKTNRVIGLDSYSRGGCAEEHPIVFVKIIDNLDFINSIMSQNGTDDSSGSVESDDMDMCEPSRKEH